jgi:DNA-binding LacI/PurR family transcriptional regulator
LIYNNQTGLINGILRKRLRMKRATISDVAAHAGVSKSTVSHALSGKRSISTATRQRIQHAIDALGYQPHPVAQRLAGGHTKTIGYVFPLYAPYIAGLEIKFIASTANEINKANYAFMLQTYPADDVDSLRRFVASGLVDGFILMQVRLEDPRVDMLRQAGIPFVLVGRCADNQGLTYVDIDIVDAMKQCVTHLAHLGHQQIAYLHQDAQDFGFTYRAQREFLAACEAQKVQPFAYPTNLSYESGAGAMATLLEQHPQVTAIITWNNTVAWGAVGVAEANGRSVPQDLSIISFGHSGLSHPVKLPLTVVDIRPEKLAATAVRLLFDKLDGESFEPKVLLKATLIIRESTAVKADGHNKEKDAQVNRTHNPLD